MAFYGLLLFLLLFCVLFVLVAMIVIAVISLIMIGSSAGALAAGGLAASAAIKDNYTKRLTILVCSAVSLFAICCFSMVGILVWETSQAVFLVLGIVSGIATFVLGIIGIVNSRKANRKAVRVLFIILFSLALVASLIAVSTFAITAFLLA